MSDPKLDEELWVAALGPPPQEPPPFPPDEDSHEGHDPLRPKGWPLARRGPHGGVFIFRWLARQMQERGLTPEHANEIGQDLQDDLVAGRVQAIAMHPVSGRTYPIPVEDWQATGERGRELRWSGVHWAGAENGVPCDVYLIAPGPARHQKAGPAPELGTRERNNAARLIYGLARLKYGDRADAHGYITKIASELHAMGFGVSDDTVAKWLERGRSLYDRDADTTRKT